MLEQNPPPPEFSIPLSRFGMAVSAVINAVYYVSGMRFA